MASTAKASAPAPAAKPSPSKSTPAKAPAKKAAGPKLSVVTNKPADPKLTAGFAALDASRAATMICDPSWQIVYSNGRSQHLLSDLENAIQGFNSGWRNFAAHEVVGSNLAFLFSDDPMAFRTLSDARNHPYSGTVKVGPATWEFHVATLANAAGNCIGYSFEWADITAKTADELRMAQLTSALDRSNTNFMLADLELNLVYMNERLTANLKKWEPELQKLFGMAFRADQLLGRCIDDFHKNPQHQRRLLGNESTFPMETMIEVGPLRIALAINTLKDASGKTIGFSTEWTDMTEKLLSEEKYKATVRSIADRMEFLRGACSTDLANAMKALADGDLTVKITPRTPLLEIPEDPDLALMANTFNELRNQTVVAVDAYNAAQDSLSAMLAETRQVAESIARSSNEVSIGNDDLAQRTEEQASSLEETASSMEEMTSTVKQNADNARQANQLALQAREAAEKGGTVVGDAVSTMAEINKASKRIADIISVIDEIAFQTNLLALNAAVEAARVGEQGRGFAVVAGEVRNLAGRSATAAKEIKSLVQDSVQKVQDGSTLVNQSGQQLDEIVNSVKKVADIISEISAAAQEQAEGIEQVNKAIIQMDQITQQNAALVEEASATSQSMNQQADGLQELVSKFVLDPAKVAAFATAAAAPSAPAARTAARPAARAAERPAARPAARPTRAASNDEFEEF